MREKIREFILSRFMLDAKPEDLKDGISFLETGVIDSTGVVELLAFLEAEFEIEVEDSEIVPENLDSVDSLCRYLESKGVTVSPP